LATDGAGRVEILSLAGLPEIGDGDDLASHDRRRARGHPGRPAAARRTTSSS
jgi:hypothetical protein